MMGQPFNAQFGAPLGQSMNSMNGNGNMLSGRLGYFSDATPGQSGAAQANSDADATAQALAAAGSVPVNTSAYTSAGQTQLAPDTGALISNLLGTAALATPQIITAVNNAEIAKQQTQANIELEKAKLALAEAQVRADAQTSKVVAPQQVVVQAKENKLEKLLPWAIGGFALWLLLKKKV